MKNLYATFCFLCFLTLTTIKSNGQQPQEILASTNPVKKLTPISGEVIKEDEKEEGEVKPTFTLSGSIDTYFHSTFKTSNYYYGDAYASSTSFADQKGFALGMVNLIATYAGEKAGFTADLVFGPRGKAAVFGTASGQAIINQAFVFYKFSDKITFNMGQFNTFVGYEVISPTVNFHYSTSYLFSWGPFNHTGARLDFTFENGIVMKAAVMNPTDLVEFNPVNTYTLGAQVGKVSDKGGIWLNFLFGDQDGTLSQGDVEPLEVSAGNLLQGDITVGYSVTEKFYMGFNASIQRMATGEEVDAGGDIISTTGDASSFYGFAVYPKIALSESFAIGLRAEYFSTENSHFASPIIGLDADGDGSVMEFTLSGNYKTGGLTFIPEFRIDKTSEDSFVSNDGETKTILPSFNLAAVYKF
jgi:hypothetical protein